jgi:hypothetical protein
MAEMIRVCQAIGLVTNQQKLGYRTNTTVKDGRAGNTCVDYMLAFLTGGRQNVGNPFQTGLKTYKQQALDRLTWRTIFVVMILVALML